MMPTTDSSPGAHSRDFRYYPEAQVSLPGHIEMKVVDERQQSTTISLSLQTHILNRLYVDPDVTWRMPTPARRPLGRPLDARSEFGRRITEPHGSARVSRDTQARTGCPASRLQPPMTLGPRCCVTPIEHATLSRQAVGLEALGCSAASTRRVTIARKGLDVRVRLTGAKQAIVRRPRNAVKTRRTSHSGSWSAWARSEGEGEWGVSCRARIPRTLASTNGAQESTRALPGEGLSFQARRESIRSVGSVQSSLFLS